MSASRTGVETVQALDSDEPASSGQSNRRRGFAAVLLTAAFASLTLAQRPPGTSRDQGVQIPVERRPGPARPFDPRVQDSDAAILTLSLEPSKICEGDRATVSWSVRDRRPGIAWAGPVQLRSSFALDPPLSNPVPSSGSRSFVAGRTPWTATFTLSTGAALTRVERSTSYRVTRIPEISRMAVQNSRGRFVSSGRVRWGERVALSAEDLGELQESDRVVVTMHQRLFTLPSRSLEDGRVVFSVPNLVPAGTGAVKISRCGGRIESNSLPLTIYTDPAADATNPEILSFGAAATTLSIETPVIIKPRSTGSTARDLSDHFALSAAVRFGVTAASSAAGAPGSTSVRFSVLTYNIAQVPSPFYEGRRDRDANIDDIARFLNEGDYGVVCLQEAFGDDSRNRLIRATRAEYPYRASGPEGALLEQDSGLLVLSRFPILEHHRQEYREGEGLPDNYVAKGIVHVRLKLGNRPLETLDVFTTHTQSGNDRDQRINRLAQFREALAFIRRHSGGDHWLLTGDLNVNAGAGDTSEYQAMMEALSQPWDLWREFHPAGEMRGFTYGEGNNFTVRGAGPSGERLDFLMLHWPKKPPPPARGEHGLRGPGTR